MSLPSHPARPVWRSALVAGVLALLVYAAFSGKLLLKPSPHFHFTDMAAGLLQGRFDTDTPRRPAGVPGKPGDLPGYQAAIDRAVIGPDGKHSGWNDWASYRVLTLKGGQEVRGVFPWKDTDGPRKHEFWTLQGQVMLIDVSKDLKVGCKQGQLWARCDEVVYQVSFPPFPAVILMPLVAVFGYNTNDVLVTLLFAALSVALWHALLRRLRDQGRLASTNTDLWWHTAFLAVGSAALYCSIRGSVWFSALAMGLTLNLLHFWFAIGARRPLLAGLFLGLGVATRTPLLFATIFLPLEALWPGGRFLGGDGKQGLWRATKQIALFGLPLAAVGAALAWHNYVRWGNPTEFGHFYLLEGTRVPTREHGLFNTIFLNNNLAASLTNMPRILLDYPYVLVTRHGLGLLASMPALAAMAGACKRPFALHAEVEPEQEAAKDSADRGLQRHLLLTVLAVAIPGWLYQNDGWQQFAYRFSMDFLPPLLLLFALRLPRLSRTVRGLIVLGVVVQVFGAVTFGRMEQFYYD
jgi:hypothetical protein